MSLSLPTQAIAWGGLTKYDFSVLVFKMYATYVGETTMNLYTRAKEHKNKYLSRKAIEESLIHTHQKERYACLPAEAKMY